MGNEIVLQQPDEGDLKGKGSELVEQARELVIASPEDYEQAAGWLQEVKGTFKVLWDRLNDPCRKAKAAHAAMCDIRDEAVLPFTVTEDIIKQKMGEYDAEVRRIREEEHRKAQALAEKKAREERDRQIAEAKKNRDKEAAQALKNAPLEVEPVAPKTPELAKTGVTHRQVWEVASIDEAKLPRQFLTADRKAIDGMVRSLGAKHGIPGVVVVQKTITSVRA